MMWNKIAESSAWTTPPPNFIPWPSSSFSRTPSSGRLFFHPRIGMLRAPDGIEGQLTPTGIAFFCCLLADAHPFDDRNSSNNSGFNTSKDGVRFGGRSNEVSDEWHWKTAASGGFDFGLRAAACRLRRSRHRGSRSGHPRAEGEHLGLEAQRATQERGPASCCLAWRDCA